MSIDIQILKNGRLQKALQLENGTYALGRAADADIVLEDSAVSKNHATLTIEDKSFQITDSGSSNGIFLQGKKFIEQTFKNSFEIEIKPFTIRTPDSAEAEIDKSAGAVVSSIRHFSINNIKTSILLLFSITMFLTVLIGYIPLKKQTETIVRQEMLKSGILLTRYLAEMNRPFLETGQKTQIRTSPIKLEDGVIYAFVVDAHGRIIAPPEKQGDFLDWPGLSSAFAGKKLKIEDGKQNEKVIFYPVRQQNKTIGAAIIGFAWQQTAGQQTAGMGVLGFFLIAILFVIGILMSHLLAKAFLNPLKTLYEEVEIAIKKGSTALDYQAPYSELNNLKRTFNRLLMRKKSSPTSFASSAGSPKTLDEKHPTSPREKETLPATAAFPSSLPASPGSGTTDEQLAEITAPWCIIDRENYTLVRHSDNFATNLGTPDCRQGMHIIEALETTIIPAVSEMIDSDDSTKLTVSHANKTYFLRRMTSKDACAADINHVILIFEEKVE
jgi:type III secretion system (T3SS) inner membrane Yop/YscD-like protein